MDDWRSSNKRNAVIQKLEEVMKASSNPSPSLQNSVEVEKAFFEKSKSKDEYNTYFHNAVLMLSRQKTHQVPQQQPPTGMIQTQTNRNPSMMNMGMSQPNPAAYGQGFNQYSGTIGPSPSQVSHTGYPNAGGLGIGTPQRPQQPPQYPIGMYPSGMGGNPGSGVHMTQQPDYPGMGIQQQGYQQQRTQMPPSNYPVPHNIGVMNGGAGFGHAGGMTVQYNQPAMVGTTMQRPMTHGPAMMRGPGMIQGESVMQQNMMIRRGNGIQGPIQSGQPPFRVDNISGVQPVQAVPNPSYTASIHSQANQTTYTSGVSANTNPQVSNQQGSAPSPFSMMSSSSSPGPQQGPSASMSPSSAPISGTQQPQQQSIPASMAESSSSSIANPPTPLAAGFQGVGSPAPPTPIYPVSPATSMMGMTTNQPVMSPEENEAYIRKLGELQKYIPVMNEWINRLSRDDRKGDQYLKLKSLYNLLHNPNKRVPLPTLMKCETALERMFDKNADKSNLLQPSSIPPSSTISSSSSTAAASAAAAIANQGDPRGPESNPPQSQSLLDFKMTYSPPPTYSNLKDIVSHINNTFDRLPTTKRRCLNREQGDFDTDEFDLPSNVRRELMQLDQFDIKVEPGNDKFSKELTLRCSLGQTCELPEVPALTIILPHDYPAVSPICDLSHYSKANPFIKMVGSLLSDKLSKRVGKYTFSTLLDCWELCVLSAISQILNDA